MMPAIVGYLVRFYDPVSQQYQTLTHLAESGYCPGIAFKRLEKTIESVLATANLQPLSLSLTGKDDNKGTWLYPLALPGLPSENYLLAIADTRLGLPQTHHLQTLAQAIASHLQIWQQQQAWQARTAELTAVLNGVEHQVRQSLGLANLYLSLLDHQELDERGQATIENLHQTITDIADRVTTMLRQSAQSPITLAWVDLKQLVAHRGRTFAPSLAAKHVTLNLPTESAWLQADPHQVGQVVDNLLCNAIAFSPLGGTIEWMWDVFEGEVLIQITDQGSGIPADALQAIFQPGYTQRPQGQGLGLAIANKIVHEYGGRIWANNLARGGAQFSIILPQNQPHQSPPTPS